MGERDEEPGLGRHRVVDAELVDEAQALLDVPVGRSRVATKIGEHALDVFEPAAREALTEPVGDRAGVVDVRHRPAHVALGDGQHRIGDPGDDRAVVVADLVEDGHGTLQPVSALVGFDDVAHGCPAGHGGDQLQAVVGDRDAIAARARRSPGPRVDAPRPAPARSRRLAVTRSVPLRVDSVTSPLIASTRARAAVVEPVDAANAVADHSTM